MDNLKTEIKAEIKPKQSSVFTTASLLVSCVLIISGSIFVSQGSYFAGGLMFLPGLVGGVASYTLGFKSQKDQDLSDSHPLQVSSNSDGMFKISADPRTDRDILLEAVATAATLTKDRKHLPDPDGLVDGEGKVDASKKQEAIEIANSINSEITEEQKAFEKAVTSRQVLEAESLRDIKVVPPSELG